MDEPHLDVPSVGAGGEEPQTLQGVLARAARNRRAAETTYRQGGLRATGFDDLLRHLHQLCFVARRESALARLVFFADRLKHDLKVGFVAAYHSMPSVGADAMRDMMEAWLLFRHFTYEPQDLEAWFTVSRRERKNRFGSIDFANCTRAALESSSPICARRWTTTHTV